MIERHRTAELIAVYQGADHDRRPRRLAVHNGYVGDAYITAFMARDIRGLDQFSASVPKE